MLHAVLDRQHSGEEEEEEEMTSALEVAVPIGERRIASFKEPIGGSERSAAKRHFR